MITRDDIVIHAPLSRIWKIQTDVEAWPTWQPDVTEVTKETRGPLREGSVFRWSVHGLQGITSTVEQAWPERRIVWGGPAQGITAVHVWTFHSEHDGVHVRTGGVMVGRSGRGEHPCSAEGLGRVTVRLASQPQGEGRGGLKPQAPCRIRPEAWRSAAHQELCPYLSPSGSFVI
ncbi:SRPBCC family protein [Streptomyces sp. NPDC002133]|uniref:SRPBCC family protein n=1 Tax=Streptomyces sp. NPDC002133 TaxID=3154409 RepID=UPI003326E064